MTETKQKPEAQIKSEIALLTRTKQQDMMFMKLTEQELELVTKLRNFESEHNELVDDKPRFLTMQSYHDLVNEYKNLQFAHKEIDLKSRLAEFKDRLKSADEMLVKLNRGISLDEKPADEVKDGEQ